MESILSGLGAVLGAVLIYTGGYGTGAFEPVKRKASEPTLLPPNLIEHFTFGYSEPLADLLWLRAIQDFDFCGESFSAEARGQYQNQSTICRRGWAATMLDAVTRIVPRYRIVYTRGALFLSVAVNEKEGAAELLERGIKVYPDEWTIYFHLGYHYSLEMNMPEKAAEAFRMAALKGSPNWVQLLAARLYSDSGKAELGIATLKEYYKDTPFEEWPVRAKERFHQLQSQLKGSP